MGRLTIGLTLVVLGSVSAGVESPIQPTIRTVAARPHSFVETHDDDKTVSKNINLTNKARLAFIERAQVWTKTDIPNVNLRAGPDGPDAFQPDEMVTCDYVETRKRGTSRKFDRAVREGDIVKVRYGVHNGEVEGSVLATRLLWALGFAADRVYPVRVTCRGCSSDPWQHRGRVSGEHTFDSAVIERKPHGHEMREGRRKAGWTWRELDLVDESEGGGSVEQRDALKLLAVFIQHTDTRRQQQRLLCLPGGLTEAGECEQPFLLLHDVGKTFGRANVFNRAGTGSVNLEEWARTPIWKDPARRIGHLSPSFTGTLGDPEISEAGRSFLANLLGQLSDRQLQDLFEVAHVDRRNVHVSSSHAPAGVEDWIAAFNRKRTEIVTSHCPA